MQANGAQIVIPNAALNVPTFIIGDVEIPELPCLPRSKRPGKLWSSAPRGRSSFCPEIPSSGGGIRSDGGDFDILPTFPRTVLTSIDLLPPTEPTFPEFFRRELFGLELSGEEAEPEPAPASPAPPSLVINGGSAVDEAALADGTNPSSPGESTSGTFTTGEGDGIEALLVNGVDVTNGGTIAGKYGVLVVTGSPQAGYDWNYTLAAIRSTIQMRIRPALTKGYSMVSASSSLTRPESLLRMY